MPHSKSATKTSADHGGGARSHLPKRTASLHRRRHIRDGADRSGLSPAVGPPWPTFGRRSTPFALRSTAFSALSIRSLVIWSSARQRGLQPRLRARRTSGRPRPKVCGCLRSASRIAVPSPINTSLIANDLLLLGVARRIDDDFLLISRPVLIAEFVQQAALLEGSKNLGQGLVDAVQRSPAA